MGAPCLGQRTSDTTPGASPLMRSWVGLITIGSATAGLLTETRATGTPVSSVVERPTETLITCPAPGSSAGETAIGTGGTRGAVGAGAAGVAIAGAMAGAGDAAAGSVVSGIDGVVAETSVTIGSPAGMAIIFTGLAGAAGVSSCAG